MTGAFEAKSCILNGQDVITPELIQKSLGMTRAVADNLLSDWHKKGWIVRLAAGCYYSKLVARTDLRALWQACDIRYGAGRYLLAGTSAWSRANWYIGDNQPIYIVTDDAPSAITVKVDGIEATPVGQYLFKDFLRAAGGKDGNPKAPQAIHPIRQLAWWHGGHCPLPMPDPMDFDWEEIARHHVQMLAVLRIKDPELTFTESSFPVFYDSLKRVTDRAHTVDQEFYEIESTGGNTHG